MSEFLVYHTGQTISFIFQQWPLDKILYSFTFYLKNVQVLHVFEWKRLVLKKEEMNSLVLKRRAVVS